MALLSLIKQLLMGKPPKQHSNGQRPRQEISNKYLILHKSDVRETDVLKPMLFSTDIKNWQETSIYLIPAHCSLLSSHMTLMLLKKFSVNILSQNSEWIPVTVFYKWWLCTVELILTMILHVHSRTSRLLSLVLAT